jgi:hypothetical protein
MNKKCYEVFVEGKGKSQYSEYVFASDIKEAKKIAERQPFSANIIEILEAQLGGLATN